MLKAVVIAVPATRALHHSVDMHVWDGDAAFAAVAAVVVVMAGDHQGSVLGKMDAAAVVVVVRCYNTYLRVPQSSCCPHLSGAVPAAVAKVGVHLSRVLLAWRRGSQPCRGCKMREGTVCWQTRANRSR